MADKGNNLLHTPHLLCAALAGQEIKQLRLSVWLSVYLLRTHDSQNLWSDT